MNKIQMRVILLSCIAVLVACVGLFIGTKDNEKPDKNLEIREEALKELEAKQGSYNVRRVILSDTSKSEAEKLAQKYHADLRMTQDETFGVLYLDDETTIQDVYENDDSLRYIEKMHPDYYGQLNAGFGREAKPVTVINEDINLKDTWEVTKGEGTQIAVIDTGIDTDNKYLSAKISDQSFDVGLGRKVADYDISVVEEQDERNSHGTAVASVLAADYDAETGIGGIAPETELVVIRLPLSEEGEISASDVILGLAYAIECDVDVINMSFSFENLNIFEKYTKLAVDSDIICVASAGNHGSSVSQWPAADENVIGVGAVKRGGQSADTSATISFSSSGEIVDPPYELSRYSSYGDNVDVVAPGLMIATGIDEKVTELSETSCSSAVVAASVALYLSQNPHTEFADVKELIYAASSDMGAAGIDWYYGCGMLDVDAMVTEEKGIITYDHLTDELPPEKHIFVRNHILQDVPEPERTYVVFDGWCHDINCEQEYDNLTEPLYEDVTVYAAWANEDEVDAFTYTVHSDNTAEITGYRGKRRYVTIPETIDGHVVTSIGLRAFAENNRAREITLPSRLTLIKDSAFYNCTKLLKIEIPDRVETIEQNAFSNCPKLGNVVIPESGNLQTIGDYAFAECGSLKGIVLPSHLQSVNATAFMKDTSLISINVASGNTRYEADGKCLYENADGKRVCVYFATGRSGSYTMDEETTRIGTYAFAYARVKNVSLPDNLETLGEYSFAVSDIETITIPNNVTIIPIGCFVQCDSLISVNLGISVNTIDLDSFSECINLETVVATENSGIQSINGYAFYKCRNLQETNFIGNKVSAIGEGVFYECSSIKEVTIPRTVKELGKGVFCLSGLETVIFEDGSQLKSIPEIAFNCCPLKRVVLPEGMTEIGEWAFMNTQLEYIYIPSTVTSIGAGAFGNCPNLIEVALSDENPNYKSIDHVLFELDEEKQPAILHTYPAGLEGDYMIPDEVKAVNDYAFTAASKLTGITFGANVTEIRKGAFLMCLGLSEVELGNQVKVVGREAFSQCNNLKQFICNSNLEELGEASLAECNNLKAIQLNEGLTLLDNYVFINCSSLEQIELPDSLQTIGNYCFSSCNQLKSFRISKGIISIGYNAFEHDRALSEITFAEDCVITRLNGGVFTSCGIRSITIPKSVSSIGAEAFRDCTNLESVLFEDNSALEKLAAWTFSGAENLKSVTFGNGSALTDIEARAFEHLTSLETVDVTKCLKLENIDNYAFYFSNKLKDFIIPENVTEIGRYAFYGCRSLVELTIPKGMDFIGRYAFTGNPEMKIYFDSAVLPAHLQEFWDYGIKGYYLGKGTLEEADNWQYTLLNDDTAVLVRYIGTDTDVTVTTVGGHEVSGIGANALTAETTVRSLTLPDTVKTICNYAFEGAGNLHTINIPTSVKVIGGYAFYKSGIETVALPDDSELVSIEPYAFAETAALTELSFPASLTQIKRYAFYQSALTDILFDKESKLEEIGRSAFEKCSLRKVQLPDGLKKVDYHGFEGNVNLEEAAFGRGTLHLYGYAFYNTGLSTITIPENVEYIGEYCFAYCKNMESIEVVTDNTRYSSDEGILFNKNKTKLMQCPAGKTGSYSIPNMTEALGFGAFEGGKISSVFISDSSKLSTIGYKAFYDCGNITSMHLPATVVSVDYYSFAYCRKLENLTIGGDSIMNGIYEGAFYGCEALKAISVPKEVKEIGEYAFYGCEALTSLEFDPESVLQGIYAHAFDYTALTSVVIPEQVYEIGDYAFAHNAFINFTTTEELREIGTGILYSCNNINTLTTGHLKYGDYATIKYLFSNGEENDKLVPDSLKTVYVVNSTNIPSGFFQGYESLETVVLDTNISSIESNAFRNCSLLKEVSGLENVSEIGEAAFADCRELITVEGLEKINAYANSVFENCSSLVLPANAFSNVSIIGDNAFKECSSLDQILFSDKLTKIGDDAFSACVNITKVEIPDLITEAQIGNGAFSLCDNLSDLTLGNGIISLGENCFYRDSALVEVVIPTSIKVVKRAAFSWSGLKYVEISEGVEKIETEAFSKTEWGAEDDKIIVWIPNSVKTIESGAITRGVVYYEGDIVPDDYSFGENININTSCGKKQYENGCHYCTKGDRNILIYYNGQDETVDLSAIATEGINEIGEFSCAYNSVIKNVIAGEQLSIIGNYAFFGCKSLQSIMEASQIARISEWAFANTSLTEIDLSDALEDIEIGAFSGCEFLKSIGNPGKIKTIGASVFCGCWYLSGKIDLSNSTISNGSLLFSRCGSGNLEVILPDNLETIGYRMFEYSHLKNFKIPDSVKYIEDGAFQFKYAIFTLSLPEGIVGMGSNVFEGSNISAITIPQNMTEFKQDSFYGASDLTVYFEASILPESLTDGWDRDIKEYKLGDAGAKLDESGRFSYLLTSEGAHITSYNGTDENLLIDTVDNYPIVSLADNLFYKNEYLKTVTISENVVMLGESLFEKCSNLESVTIANNSNIEKISDCCFKECKSLKTVVLPDNLKIIGKESFRKNSKLFELSIPNSLTTIDQSAFAECPFSEIKLPDELEELGGGVFFKCQNLLHIKIPKKIKNIHNSTFWSCSKLKTAELPDGVEMIEWGAFSECVNLETINIPDSLQELSSGVFFNCDKLLEEEGGLYYVENCLVGYKRLETLIDYSVREGTTVMANDIFNGCPCIQSINLSNADLKRIPENAFHSSTIKKIEIPDSVESIGYAALANVNQLESISLSTMGENGFTFDNMFAIGDCWPAPIALKSVTINGDNESVNISCNFNIESIIFAGNVRELSIRGEMPLKELQLPSGLVKLNKIDLYGNEVQLDKLEIPESVQEIGVIYGYNWLKELNIPSTVNKIGNISAASIVSLEIPSTVSSIEGLRGCNGLEKLVLPIDENKTDNYLLKLFTDGSIWEEDLMPHSLKEVEINGSPKKIPDKAFWACKFLEKVTLPDSVEEIGDNAFNYCSRLKNVNMPKSLKSIGDNSFQSTSIEKLTIPEGVEIIGDGSFQHNHVLMKVTIPSTVIKIGGGVFSDSGVEQLTLKCKGATIAENAFCEMDYLKSVTIPFVGHSESDICILQEMFSRANLDNLEKVILLQSCDTITQNTFDGITGIAIYCYADGAAASWPEGWNNGNKVYYLDTWSSIEFCVDGNTVATSIQGTGEAIKLPARSLREKADDSRYSYTFVGWDVNGDGSADSIFAENLKNYVVADAVYSKIGKEQTADVRENVEISEESAELNAAMESGDYLRSVASVSGEDLGNIAGKPFKISTNVGNVVFDKDATSKIDREVSGNDLQFSMEKVDVALHSEAGDSEALYAIGLTSGSNLVSFGDDNGAETSGLATVSVPYDIDSTSQPEVTYISEDGKETLIDSVFNEKEGIVTFTTSHFSLYKIGARKNEICTLTFDVDGGNSIENYVRGKGHYVELPGCEKTDMIFDCWTDKNGNKYKAGDLFLLNEDVTLTAQWKERIDLSALQDTVKLDNTSYTYTGKEIRPAVTVEGLTEGTDYELSYANNIKAGTAQVILLGMGAYKGTVSIEFTILECDHEASAILYTGEGEKEATCLEDGKGHTECMKCGDILEIKEIPVLGHDYTSEVTKEPGAEEKGEMTYTCRRCGDSYTETIPAKGHQYDTENPTYEWSEDYSSCTEVIVCTDEGCEKKQTEECTVTVKEIKKATCTEDGEKEYTATGIHGTDIQTVPVKAAGHQSETIDEVKPTCTETGLTEGSRCSVCGEILKAQEVVKALGHDYTSEVTKEPGAEEEGERTYTCSRCGDSYTEPIPAKGHQYDTENPTYEWSEDHSSCTEVIVCTDEGCGKEQREDCTVTVKETKKATCTEDGEKEYTATGIYGTDIQTVPVKAAGHQSETIDEVKPTCTETGLTEGSRCSVCREILKAQEVVKALGHDYTSEVTKEPGAEEEGERTYTCSRCGDSYTEPIPAKGHQYDTENPTYEWSEDYSSCTEVIVCTDEGCEKKQTEECTVTVKEIKKATCTEDGEKEYTATGIYGTDIQTVPVKAAGHQSETMEEVKPTCTETGLTEGSRCSVCGEILKAQEVVKALGHDYTSEVTKEPGAEEEGERTYTCSRCGDSYTEPVPAKGHQYDTNIIISAEDNAGTFDRIIINKKDNKDYPGAIFHTLSAKASKVTQTSVKISWKHIAGADHYVIYGSECGKAYNKIGVALGASYTQKKLTKGKYYKYMILAVDSNNKVLSVSKTICASTLGGKTGNYKQIKLNKKQIVLKKGKVFKIKVKLTPNSTKLKIKKYRGVLFESADPFVATVNKSGKIKAKQKGCCYIYAYTQNGIYSKVKVTVK